MFSRIRQLLIKDILAICLRKVFGQNFKTVTISLTPIRESWNK